MNKKAKPGEFRMELPAGAAQFVIGTRGKNISAFSSEFRAHLHVDDKTNQLVVVPNSGDDISNFVHERLVLFLQEKHNRLVRQRYAATLLGTPAMSISLEEFPYAQGYFHIEPGRMIYQLRFVDTGGEDVARMRGHWASGTFPDTVETAIKSKSTKHGASSTAYDRRGIFVSTETDMLRVMDMLGLVRKMHAPASSYKMIIAFGRQLFTFPSNPKFQSRPFSKTLFENMLKRGDNQMRMVYHPIIPGSALQPLLDYLYERNYVSVDMDNPEFHIYYNQIRTPGGLIINQHAVVQSTPSNHPAPKQGTSRIKTRPCMFTMINPNEDMCDIRLHATAYHDENWSGKVRAVGEVVQRGETSGMWERIRPEFSGEQGQLTSLTYSVQRDASHADTENEEDAKSIMTSAWNGSVTDTEETPDTETTKKKRPQQWGRKKTRWCYHQRETQTTIIIIETKQEGGDKEDTTYIEVQMFHDSWRSSRRNTDEAEVSRTLIETLREARKIASLLVAKFPQTQ